MPKTMRGFIILPLIAAFILSSLYVPQAQAGEMVMPFMPKPGVMVSLSYEYTPAYLKGIVIHPDNALKFDFLIHKGDGNLDDAQKQIEYSKLVKYFLAALTVPDRDQWVNLSPYEKNRIVQNDFGNTVMGRDLLSQDYLLKQLTSSLMYPESRLGKDFWNRVYERAHRELGTTAIPVNTFNKVWIVPDQATIYENGNTAYVVSSHLKVMLEEDYLSLRAHTAIAKPGIRQNALHAVSSKIIKEVILPEIEREVNEDKNFAMLRQIFSGMVLATWYKKALRESLLGQVYADKDKVLGVNQNPRNNEAIYQEYLKAFKKGVYNYVKEDVDRYTNEVIPRKYFAGGAYNDFAQISQDRKVSSQAMTSALVNDDAMATEDMATISVIPMQNKGTRDQAMAPETAQQRVVGLVFESGKETTRAREELQRAESAFDILNREFTDGTPEQKLRLAAARDRRDLLETELLRLRHRMEIIMKLVAGQPLNSEEREMLTFYKGTLSSKDQEALQVLLGPQIHPETKIPDFLKWVVGTLDTEVVSFKTRQTIRALRRLEAQKLYDGDMDTIMDYIKSEYQRLQVELAMKESDLKTLTRDADIRTTEVDIRGLESHIKQLIDFWYYMTILIENRTPKTTPLQPKIYKSIGANMPRKMAEDLVEVMQNVAAVNGFNFSPDKREAVTQLMEEYAEIYKGMGLSIQFYHNQIHNLAVAIHDLQLASNKGLVRNEEELMLNFMAALNHDLHVRLAQAAPGETARPAYVHETVGKPGTQEGGQLLDLLGGRSYVMPAVLNARYIAATEAGRPEALISEAQKETIRALYGRLLDYSDEKRQEFIAKLIVLIRRTDFPSDVPEAGPVYKGETDKVREMIDAQFEKWRYSPINDDKLKELKKEVKGMYRKIYEMIDEDKRVIKDEEDARAEGRQSDLRGTIKTWLNRQQEIELNFLDAFIGVDELERFRTFEQAVFLETADQTAAKMLFELKPGDQIVDGLHGENEKVTKAGGYAFFDTTQILPDRVLKVLNYAPLLYKAMLIKRLQRDAELSVQDGPDLPIFKDALQRWETVDKNKVLRTLGIYEDNGHIHKQTADPNIMQLLRDSFRVPGRKNEFLFNESEFHAIAASGAVQIMEPLALHQEIIHDGQQVIFKDSDEAKRNDWLYIVVSGSVGVYSRQGTQINELRRGQIFGDWGLLNGHRTATVRVKDSDTVLARLSSDIFYGLLSYPKFRNFIYSKIPGMLQMPEESAKFSWMESNVLSSMVRGHDQQWQVADEFRGRQEASWFLKNLGPLIQARGSRKIKTVEIIYPVRPNTPLVAVYPNVIAGGYLIVFSNEIVQKSQAEIQALFSKALKDAAMKIDMKRLDQRVAEVKRIRAQNEREVRAWREAESFGTGLSPTQVQLIYQFFTGFISFDILETRLLEGENGKRVDPQFAFELSQAASRKKRELDFAMKDEAGIRTDHATVAVRDHLTPGGIDLNSANMDLVIKRDGRGVPLPLAQQDMAQLSHIRGFVPKILEIKPASSLPILNGVS